MMATPIDIIHLERVDSTQDEARARFGGTPLLVTATGQDRGRGRSGSQWLDADRALAASIAFRPSWPGEAWPRLTLVAGLAALDVLPFRFGLKWPNDLMIADRKAGGFLAETSDESVVIGFGLNIFWADPPGGMTGVHATDPGGGHGRVIAQKWAEALLERAARAPHDWGREEYAARCVTVGTEVVWNPGGSGRATGIAADGGLVVVSEGREQVITSGAVQNLRAP